MRRGFVVSPLFLKYGITHCCDKFARRNRSLSYVEVASAGAGLRMTILAT
jgi:hypothetical protein